MAKLGIIGGGQLAWMLGQAARSLQLECRALIATRQDSAVHSVADCMVGSIQNPSDRATFFEGLSHCTFENEFVDVAPLFEYRDRGVVFFPPLEVIQRLQNKKNQKLLLNELHIGTSAFAVPSKEMPLDEWAQSVLRGHEASSVFKWSTFGYDGKGILLSPNPVSLESFVKRAEEAGTDLYVEEKVSFVCELALVAVRSVSGEIQSYPLVRSEQKSGICHSVMGPGSALGIPDTVSLIAELSLKKLLNHLNYVGTLAAEFFLTSKNVLLINELAPRVHNTAHYSQDASMTSQFENHLRAGMGLPLGATKPQGVFGMLNLVGVDPKKHTAVDAQMKLYDYQKPELRLGRKMGHMNFWDRDIETLRKRMEVWERKISHA